MLNNEWIDILHRDAPRGGAGGAAAPPDFGRSEGAAGRRRHATTCHITTCPPGFLTLATPLCDDVGNEFLGLNEHRNYF